MAYIFLDESGDLGFDFTKKKTSKNFVITFLITENKDPIEKIVKKTFRSFTKKERKFHHGTLHAHKETEAIKRKVLNSLKDKDIQIITVYLNKKKVYTRLQETKHALYNYVANILLDRLYKNKKISINGPIHLIASRRETNRFLNENFKSYLKRQIENNHKLKIVVEIKAPQDEKCLQIVDLICWSIFRKKEHGDKTYYNLIKDKIKEEKSLFS